MKCLWLNDVQIAFICSLCDALSVKIECDKQEFFDFNKVNTAIRERFKAIINGADAMDLAAIERSLISLNGIRDYYKDCENKELKKLNEQRKRIASLL